MHPLLWILAGGVGGVGGQGPTAPPFAVGRELYGGTLIRALWSNGDTSAETKVYIDTGSGPLNAGTAPPGATSFETGVENNPAYIVLASHYLNGQETELVPED